MLTHLRRPTCHRRLAKVGGREGDVVSSAAQPGLHDGRQAELLAVDVDVVVPVDDEAVGVERHLEMLSSDEGNHPHD